MAENTYNGLSAANGRFKTPAAAITLGEQDLVQDLGCRLQKVTVNLSRKEASTADIELWDCYDMAAHSLASGFKSAASPGAKIKVELGYKSNLTEVFSGYIDAVTLELSTEDAYVVHIIACDVTKLLKDNTRCRIFKGTSCSSVFSEVMGDYAWICGCSSDSTPALEEETAWWQRGSDYDFIVEELAGIHNPDFNFYVDRGTAYFKKKEKGTAALCLEPGDSIEEFCFSWKYINKKIQVQGISQAHEAYLGESQAAGGHVDDNAAEGEEFHLVPQADTQDKADALAAALAEEQGSRAVEGTITVVGIPQLIPGKCLELTGFDSWVNGTYPITQAEHVMDGDGYMTKVTLGGA